MCWWEWCRGQSSDGPQSPARWGGLWWAQGQVSAMRSGEAGWVGGGSELEAGGRPTEHPACAGPGVQGEGCLLSPEPSLFRQEGVVEEGREKEGSGYE